MNVFSKIFIACISIIGIVSCTDMNSWGDSRTPCLKANFIYFPQSQIELGGSGNLSATVQLQAVSTPWKISNPATDWLTVSPMEGTSNATVTFTAKENPTSDNIRTAVLSLESTDASYSFSHALTVNQSKANSILTPSEKSISFTRESQTQNIIVSANTNWTASCSASWIHVTKVSDTSLDIQVDENNDASERNATITLSGSATSEIKVTQTGISVTPSLTNVEFTREAQTKTIDIASNYTWSASCSASWVHLTASPATSELSITADANNGTTDRTGSISLSKCSSTISILQHGYEFNDLVSELDFNTQASTQTLSIQTDGAWTATPDASWIHVSLTSGTGNATLSITVDRNEGTEERKGTISVTVGDVTKYVSVQQKGAYMDVSTNLISTIPAAGGTRSVTFSTSEDWTVESSNSWVSVDKTSGSAGISTITLTFSKNAQQADRTDETIIKTKNANLQNIKIITTQSGMYLYIVSSSISEISADGGTRTVTFSSSDDWTIDCNGSTWVSSDKTSGSAGTNTITLSFTSNTSNSSRTNTTYIKTNNSDLQNLTISTTQKGVEILNNGHDYVDLGLTSGTLWATMNIGASSPENYGDYYAWGEILPYKIGTLDNGWSTYKWCNGSISTITKYCTNSTYGTVDNIIQLELEDDAARQNWGGSWRIPTKDQINELLSECTSQWVTLNNVYGRKVTSKNNGNSIFMPAAGFYGLERKICDAGVAGDYWSSNLSSSDSNMAYTFGFLSQHWSSNDFYRCNGFSIRPVICK